MLMSQILEKAQRVGSPKLESRSRRFPSKAPGEIVVGTLPVELAQVYVLLSIKHKEWLALLKQRTQFPRDKSVKGLGALERKYCLVHIELELIKTMLMESTRHYFLEGGHKLGEIGIRKKWQVVTWERERSILVPAYLIEPEPFTLWVEREVVKPSGVR